MSLDFYLTKIQPTDVYWSNYTHNVSGMWKAAGCYEALYESDGKRAGDIIEALNSGLTSLLKDPQKYKEMNPSNGWGDYEGAIEFLRSVIDGCRENPDAIIRISR